MRNDPATTLIESLRRLRRRAIMVQATRHSLITVPAGIVAASMLAAISGGDAQRIFGLVGFATAAGAVAGILAALLRAPTMQAVAMLVDRRLHLENRATAALQFVADSDPVARLVVRDGAERLEACRGADAFAVELPKHSRWLLASAIVAPLLLGAVDVSRPLGDRGPSGPGGGATAGSARSAAGAGAATADARDAAAAPGESVQKAGAVTPADATDAATPPVNASLDPSSRSESALPSPASADQRGAGDPRTTQDAASTANHTADASGALAASAAASRGASGTATGAAAPGGASTAAGASEMRQSGGGVAGGSLTKASNTPAGNPEPTFTQAELARYRGSWDRAQAALGDARIPADQRPYVKAYFDAIRSAVRR